MAVRPCTNCGAALGDESESCSACGTAAPSGGEPSQASAREPAPESRPKPRVTRNLLVAIIVVAVGAAVALSVYEYEYHPGGAGTSYTVNVTQVRWTQNGAA